ncbi:SMODS domain-containing nucleotidyltransferase [Variovorax paradoxus]|uniref:SMODS domain-containing nucleotidyltransferase n=1 Tax=Variovorax paradoxus TaxID=34073 RepID=UPI003ED15D53
MPTSVAAAFTQFYENINLDGDYRAMANTRRDDIIKKLSKDFEIIESFSTGSIPKYTALKGSADLDVMVALHFTKHIKDRTPTQVLQAVRNSLAAWKTGTRRNGQAITLHYNSFPDVDIVPVSRAIDAQGKVTHYNVPDSNTDGWIKSRPKELAAALEQRSMTCGPNFRRIIKMIKVWNRGHSDYLTSYHIEVLALKTFNSNLDDLPWQILQFFKHAKEFLRANLWYDTGFADEYLNLNDRAEVTKRLDTATQKATLAWYHTYGSNNNHKAAMESWKQIFGEKFPNYG